LSFSARVLICFFFNIFSIHFFMGKKNYKILEIIEFWRFLIMNLWIFEAREIERLSMKNLPKVIRPILWTFSTFPLDFEGNSLTTWFAIMMLRFIMLNRKFKLWILTPSHFSQSVGWKWIRKSKPKRRAKTFFTRLHLWKTKDFWEKEITFISIFSFCAMWREWKTTSQTHKKCEDFSIFLIKHAQYFKRCERVKNFLRSHVFCVLHCLKCHNFMKFSEILSKILGIMSIWSM
jgi:hypothetical protein